jgi:DNA transformation protein
MEKPNSFDTWILENLSAIPSVRAQRMFGGSGIYADDAFFGILFDGRLYFFTDDATRGTYADAGSGPFRPSPKQQLKNYYEVPIEVMEDPAQLVEWAEAAIRARRG